MTVRRPAPVCLKEKLAARRPTIGSWITLAHPALAEIMAKAGFDWVAVDLEHSVITIREAEELIRVIDLCGAAPLVRLTSNDADLIKRVMDAGSRGVIVPLVRNRQEAEKAVASVYYPPRGRRGVGLARAQDYGPGFNAYRARLEREGVVIVMIEHEEAVENAESILSVPGVDGYLLGPYDLSASLGVPGQLSHPKVERAIAQVKACARRLGKAGGLHVIEPEPAELKRRLKEGFTFLAYSLDIRLVDTACRAGLKAVR